MNRIQVIASGHHERAEFATALITRLVDAGFDVWVTSDLRPRLAQDLALLLDAGAHSIHLSGSSIAALVVKESMAPEIVVRGSDSDQSVELDLVPGTGLPRAELVATSDPSTAERLSYVLRM